MRNLDNPQNIVSPRFFFRREGRLEKGKAYLPLLKISFLRANSATRIIQVYTSQVCCLWLWVFLITVMISFSTTWNFICIVYKVISCQPWSHLKEPRCVFSGLGMGLIYLLKYYSKVVLESWFGFYLLNHWRCCEWNLFTGLIFMMENFVLILVWKCC